MNMPNEAPPKTDTAADLVSEPVNQIVHTDRADPWQCSVDFIATPPQPTQWLIQDILPAGTIVLFSGRPGTYKTWIALDWARSVAEGSPWLARPCQKGQVLYLDAEMPQREFRNRVHAVGASTNLNLWRV